MRAVPLLPPKKVIMTKKWIAITLLLLAITGLLAWRLHLSIQQFKAENDLAKIQPIRDIKQKMVPEKPMPRPVSPKGYNVAEFGVIPENNLFMESRTKEEKVEQAPPELPPLAQKPILVGVSIVDDVKRASIIDPTAPSTDRNRRAQVKRIGDVYHGYTITEIVSDHIVLEGGARKEIIPLHEGTKRPQAGKTSIQSTRIVSIGGGGGGGGIPVNIVGAAGRSGSTPVGAQGATAVTQPVGGAAAGQRPGAANATPTAVQTPQTPSNVRTDPQGRRVVRTPFGDIVRPAPQ
jgi:hypothetical protein